MGYKSYDPRDVSERPVELVYVRPVRVTDLPQDVQDQAGAHDILYQLTRPSGEQLALVGNRQMAFELARQNDLDPVTLH